MTYLCIVQTNVVFFFYQLLSWTLSHIDGDIGKTDRWQHAASNHVGLNRKLLIFHRSE